MREGLIVVQSCAGSEASVMGVAARGHLFGVGCEGACYLGLGGAWAAAVGINWNTVIIGEEAWGAGGGESEDALVERGLLFMVLGECEGCCGYEEGN